MTRTHHLHLGPPPQTSVRALPPTWDGYRVEWAGWSCGRIVLCGTPAEACPRCATTEHPRINWGRYALPGPTGAPIRWRYLTAWRCPTCHLDTVVDDREQTWTLDASDHDGSHPA